MKTLYGTIRIRETEVAADPSIPSHTWLCRLHGHVRDLRGTGTTADAAIAALVTLLEDRGHIETVSRIVRDGRPWMTPEDVRKEAIRNILAAADLAHTVTP